MTSFNACTAHGIDHFSFSQIDLWMDAPAIYVLRYLKGIKDGGSPALWRGSAVEDGMKALLNGLRVEDAILMAHQSFDLNVAGEISDEIDTERKIMPDMVRQCSIWRSPNAMLTTGMLLANQVKIEYWMDGIPVPFVGYVDFAFENTDLELKTTKQCPSSPRANNRRQASLYRTARGRECGLLYVTPKRHEYFQVTDEQMKEDMEELERAAHSLYSFLGRVENADDALSILPPPDKSSYRYPKGV